MATWSLCAIVLSNAYTGKIISNLLAPHRSSIVNSLEELTTSSLSWVIRRGTSLESRFLVKTNHFVCIGYLFNFISLTISQDADQTNIVHWKIGELFRENPELMIKNGPDRFQKIRNYVGSGKYAYIGVSCTIYSEQLMQ